MAKWLVGPILEKLIDVGFEYLRYQPSMKDMLQRLRNNYPKIQAIVSVARRAQMIDQDLALNQWIWQIRDAIDEVDDFFDELEYLNLKEQLDRNKEENKVRYISNIPSVKEDPLDLKKLEELVQKLDIIFEEASTFLHLFEIVKQEQWEHQVELHHTRETGSLPKNDLIGRGKDKESVIQWLRQPSDVTTTALYHNISLLSIVGGGGMGKTTLLQHVYQDEIRKEFDLRMWVCVSDHFDVKKVIADMLESIDHNMPSLESLNELQKSLKSKVMSKKFLLVLDDLWDNEEEVVLRGKWGDVLAPLAYGALGSKILITTRMDFVASMIAKVIRKKKEALRLEGLKEDECLQLLTTHAFDNVENANEYKKLRSIAGELVKKLYGSPLVAKVMGGVLNSSLNERHWRNVLNSSLDFSGIIPILKLSYILLPEHLQICFSFCSIFAQYQIFDKYDLVRMWIAVGFIQPSQNNQGETLTLEDIGERYFDVLIKKSFFDKVSTRGYKMHDLLHELAQSVSKQECFRFVGDEMSQFLRIPKTIRHLSVETSNSKVLKEMGRFKNLRTLFITCYYQDFGHDLIEVVEVIRSIRLLHINNIRLEVLNINDIPLKEILEGFGSLHHLRYLRLPVSNYKILRGSITILYHLQFIIFDEELGDYSNDYVQSDMNNLSNLRYINFPRIGKLNFLQQPKEFNIKDENGFRIEELEHVKEPRILRINNLENVRDALEARNAKLCDKIKLEHLYLQWNYAESDIADRDLAERVLDNLQPHNNLKKLDISNYMGTRFAKWMNEAHLTQNLEVIELYNCLEWEILPPFGQLPFLKTLCLENMPKVKQLENKSHGNDMCYMFPSLETLCFENLEALVDWFDERDGFLFPCLTKLYLSNCPKLKELSYLPPMLESLEINNIGWETLNCISKSFCLETLEVCGCQNITSISMTGEIAKLKKLKVTDCQKLTKTSISPPADEIVTDSAN